MRRIIFRFVSGVGIILLLALGSVGAQEPAQTNSEIEEKAMSILKRMADYLSKAQSFSVMQEISYDAVQESGQKIEFGSVRKVTIIRPNRARIDVTDRDGSKSGFIFDGKQIAVFNTEPNVYATVSKAGTLDEAMDYFTEDLDMVLPLAELYSSELPAHISDLVDSIYYVDESIIDGVNCDHLAAQTAKTDFEIWIAKGEKPLPRRIVINYKNEVGQPQFRAELSDWNLSPKISDSNFAFTPSSGAKKIPFAPWKTASAVGEKTEGGEK